MNFSNEGLSLWYRTPDAPAPDDDSVVPRQGVSIVVGVRPASPANSVLVRYRVDGGLVQSIPGREVRTDHQRQAQYFAATFPAFPTGSVVEYAPLLTCAGRQVPAAHVAERFPSRFRLAERPALASSQPLMAPAASMQALLRYPARVDFVASVAVTFGGIEYVTDTPAGMRVNFFVTEGTVRGDGLSARVTPRSSDQLTVRRDGMGAIRIRAVFATGDGAVLDVEAGGYVDFGPDGYRQALAGNLPDRSPIVINPLISTRHPTYRWLNRIQCVGVGETRLHSNRAYYDVYAAVPRDIPATR